MTTYAYSTTADLVGVPAAGSAGKEAPMELSMRLQVLAALASFGFIAAIVIGMV